MRLPDGAPRVPPAPQSHPHVGRAGKGAWATIERDGEWFLFPYNATVHGGLPMAALPPTPPTAADRLSRWLRGSWRRVAGGGRGGEAVSPARENPGSHPAQFGTPVEYPWQEGRACSEAYLEVLEMRKRAHREMPAEERAAAAAEWLALLDESDAVMRHLRGFRAPPERASGFGRPRSLSFRAPAPPEPEPEPAARPRAKSFSAAATAKPPAEGNAALCDHFNDPATCKYGDCPARRAEAETKAAFERMVVEEMARLRAETAGRAAPEPGGEPATPSQAAAPASNAPSVPRKAKVEAAPRMRTGVVSRTLLMAFEHSEESAPESSQVTSTPQAVRTGGRRQITSQALRAGLLERTPDLPQSQRRLDTQADAGDVAKQLRWDGGAGVAELV